MKETPEVLLKRTRNELSEMAEKLGINTVGISKTKIADFIFEARKKTEKGHAKEASKPMAKAPNVGNAFKAQPMPHIGTNIGKKGVFAKRAAISAQMDVNAEAVAAIGTGVKEMQTSINNMMFAMDMNAKNMRQEGSAKLHKGVDQMQKNINAQIKANEKAAAKMGTGIKEMHKGIQELQSAFDEKTHQLQIGVKEMHSGVKEIQKGIHQMETKFGEYRNETANYIKDFYYG
jgi:methyl-accepting chemotaxis protein